MGCLHGCPSVLTSSTSELHEQTKVRLTGATQKKDQGIWWERKALAEVARIDSRARARGLVAHLIAQVRLQHKSIHRLNSAYGADANTPGGRGMYLESNALTYSVLTKTPGAQPGAWPDRSVPYCSMRSPFTIMKRCTIPVFKKGFCWSRTTLKSLNGS
jgi:hypothetical protein